MAVTEQTDSLRMLGSDPVDYLVSPRVLACMIAAPILTLMCFVMGAPCTHLLLGRSVPSCLTPEQGGTDWHLNSMDCLASPRVLACMIAAPISTCHCSLHHVGQLHSAAAMPIGLSAASVLLQPVSPRCLHLSTHWRGHRLHWQRAALLPVRLAARLLSCAVGRTKGWHPSFCTFLPLPAPLERILPLVPTAQLCPIFSDFSVITAALGPPLSACRHGQSRSMVPAAFDGVFRPISRLTSPLTGRFGPESGSHLCDQHVVDSSH